MLKDVTLGQFFPGSSIVHRLDPRCKLLLTIVYIAALFTAESYVSYAVMLIITGVCIALSRIQLKVILRGLKPLWVIIALTAVLNMFFTPGRELVSFWKITVTYEGLIRAVFMVLRITMLIAGTFLLTYTTSPIALTDAMEILFGPLKKAQSARARDEHDDVHGPALHPHAHRGDGQDHVRAESARRRF